MTRTSPLFKAAAVFGVAAPVLVVFAAAGTGVGWFPFDTGFGLLTMQVAPMLAWAGVAIGLIALGLWVWRRPAPIWVVAIALLPPILTLGAFHLMLRQADGLPPIHETATDWTQPLAISRGGAVEAAPVVPTNVGEIRAAWAPWAGRPVVEINAETCPGARTIPRLVPSAEVIAALRAEDVRVFGEAPWRVSGVQESSWYGRQRDVVVRMNPGATDIRVSERVGLTDLGQTCRLVTALVERLGG